MAARGQWVHRVLADTGTHRVLWGLQPGAWGLFPSTVEKTRDSCHVFSEHGES